MRKQRPGNHPFTDKGNIKVVSEFDLMFYPTLSGIRGLRLCEAQSVRQLKSARNQLDSKYHTHLEIDIDKILAI
jgi:hypothetical protein